MNSVKTSSKIIIFSSHVDDAGMLKGAFAGVDSPFWEEFKGKQCRRFFTMLETEQGSYSSYDSLQGTFDLLVIWEPPLDEVNEWYQTLLTNVEQEFVNLGGVEGADLLVGYHQSCRSEYKLLQKHFIEKIGVTAKRILTKEYSHIDNDELYMDSAALLKKTVAGDCLRDEYHGLLRKLKSHWLMSSFPLPYLNAMFLFLDTMLGQNNIQDEYEGNERGFREYWKQLVQNEGDAQLKYKLTEELKIIKAPQLMKQVEELFFCLEAKIEPDNAILKIMHGELLERLQEACQ